MPETLAPAIPEVGKDREKRSEKLDLQVWLENYLKYAGGEGPERRADPHLRYINWEEVAADEYELLSRFKSFVDKKNNAISENRELSDLIDIEDVKSLEREVRRRIDAVGNAEKETIEVLPFSEPDIEKIKEAQKQAFKDLVALASKAGEKQRALIEQRVKEIKDILKQPDGSNPDEIIEKIKSLSALNILPDQSKPVRLRKRSNNFSFNVLAVLENRIQSDLIVPLIDPNYRQRIADMARRQHLKIRRAA